MAQCYDDHDEVSIPRDMAKEIADYLRGYGVNSTRTWKDWAEALDPEPTLRDEIASAIAFMRQSATIFPKADEEDYEAADAALSVVREKVGTLMLTSIGGKPMVSLESLLAVLGVNNE